MKRNHIIIFRVLAALIIAYAVSIIPNFHRRSEWDRAISALQSLPREHVVSAIEGFVKTQNAQNRTIANMVSLRELVSTGFIRAEATAPFSDMDVTFATKVDVTRPDLILIRVRLPSGDVVVELTDGSIQKLAQ
ncbi:MAG: hypothetical protein EBS05_03335 [Proteobacteria bacterium]|nr:hypothetical protein [Pseudomonadota bacterium]